MDKKNLNKVIFNAIPALLIFLIVFITEKIIGNLTLSLPILVIIGLVSFGSIIIGAFFLNNILNLSDRTENLQKGLEHLFTIQAIFVSDESLKNIESRAKKIRIISPDLTDDLDEFYVTILENIKLHKTYEYVIPNREEVIGKMERLINHLRRDAKFPAGKNLPIEFRIIKEFPIITEFIVYDCSGFNDLQGFQELQLGLKGLTVTNMALKKEDTYKLNRWFDQLFSV